MLEKAAFINFLSFCILYGLVIILWLTNESKELDRTFSVYYTSYSGIAKVSNLIRYSQSVNLVFIEHALYLYLYLLIDLVMYILLKLYYL